MRRERSGRLLRGLGRPFDTEIGQTHPAVSQLAVKLRKAGWITRRTDKADARRGVLELTVGPGVTCHATCFTPGYSV